MNNPPKSTAGFDAAYDAYGVMVYRLAMVYLGRSADAEDVTQEVFFRLLYRSPAFHDAEHEKRWLLRVAVNLCKNQLGGFWRRQVVALPQDDSIAPVGAASPAGAYSFPAPDVAALADALVRLPGRYKIPIHLHYYEGYSVAEIANILQLGQSAVKMRLKRGRNLLKLELEEDR